MTKRRARSGRTQPPSVRHVRALAGGVPRKHRTRQTSQGWTRLGSRFVFLGAEGRLTRACGRCGVH